MILILILIICVVVGIPLGIAKGLNDARIKKEDSLFKKEVLKNMEKQNK